MTGRVVLEGRPIHIPDVLADPEYQNTGYQRIFGYRTDLGVPLLREGTTIGVFSLTRDEVNPFTEKQIELVTTFADQAVIAIENARLLNELRESLDQQTATSEVLRVESAARLCDASFGNIFRWQDDALRLVATYNTPAAFAEARGQLPLRRNQNNPIVEMLAAKTVLHVADLSADERYINRRDPNVIAAVELGGIRTFLAVPMLKDDELIAALIVYRQEVRPFSDKQIEFVKNFAARAVIAIENARLLTELREALEQQTATSEVLKVISASPGELEPVFRGILENATRICQAQFGTLNLYDAGAFRTAALHNPPAQFAQRLGATIRAHPASGLARVARTREIAHIDDISNRATLPRWRQGRSRACRPRQGSHRCHRPDAQ
jgi:GAF domain-containing protein